MEQEADVIYLHPPKHGVKLRVSPDAPPISPYALMPVGIPGMMNLLRRHGLRVLGLNVFLETLLDLNFDLKTWLKKQAPPRLFAIDLHWYEHCFGALDVASLCKQVHPKVPIVLGGLTASYFAREILASFPQVDFIIRGDGEQPLLRLALALCGRAKVNWAEIPNLTYRVDEHILETPCSYSATAEELDQLDAVDMDWLLHAPEYMATEFNGPKLIRPTQAAPDSGAAFKTLGSSQKLNLRGHWLTIGRGCCFNCSFCGGGRDAHAILAGRKGIIARSPASVANDIQRLHKQGVNQISFNLDPAILGKPYWKTLFAELQEREIRIGLYDELFQLPEHAFFDALSTVAEPQYSEMVISPLSGAEDVRRLNGKEFSNQQLLDALAHLKQLKLPVFIYFSLNLPGENDRTFRQTLRLAEEIARLYPPHLLRMANMLHTLDPCSPMSQAPTTYRIKVEFKTFADYYRYCRETPAARSNIPLGAWRGFEMENKAMRSLESMAAQWDEFCRRQRAQCMPVPRIW